MKTSINPATISLHLDGINHILPLEKAKEIVASLEKEIEALEGPKQSIKIDLPHVHKYGVPPVDLPYQPPFPFAPYTPTPTYPWTAPPIYCGTIDTKTQ